MSVENKKILVTGGAGFIGSHIADEALRRGASRVVILDNFVNGKQQNIAHLAGDSRITIESGDVRDFDTVRPLVQQADIVFHEAASKLVVSRTRPRIDLETNIVGTFNVLEAAKDGGQLVVHASTGSVLGSSEGEMHEDHPQNPTTLYGISKGCGERYCRFYAAEFGVRVAMLRYFHVFGPRQDYSGEAGVVSIFLGRVLRGLPPVVFGTGEQIRCFTWVLDDVAANFLLLDRIEGDECLGQVHNVASRTRISVLDLANTIIERFGPKGLEVEFGPPRPGENLRPVPNTERIERLGFKESVSFSEGLEATCEWVKKDLGL